MHGTNINRTQAACPEHCMVCKHVNHVCERGSGSDGVGMRVDIDEYCDCLLLDDQCPENPRHCPQIAEYLTGLHEICIDCESLFYCHFDDKYQFKKNVNAFKVCYFDRMNALNDNRHRKAKVRKIKTDRIAVLSAYIDNKESSNKNK